MPRWTKITLALLALILLILAALPYVINPNAFRPRLESQLTAALGRQVKLGALHLNLLRGHLSADDLSIADDPDYSLAPFLTASELQIGADLPSLIFSRQLNVRSFLAVAPRIHLVHGAETGWNFSSITRRTPLAPGNRALPEGLPLLTVGLITIQDGRAVVESRAQPGQQWTYDHINLSVEHFSSSKAFPFSVSASLPGDSTISVNGTLGPIHQQDAAMTPLDAQLSVKQLNPLLAGFLDPAIGLSFVADLDAHAASDGVTLTSDGTVHLQHLQLRKGGAPVPNPVDLTYKLTHTYTGNRAEIPEATLKINNVTLQLSGAAQLLPADPVLNCKLVGRAMSIDDLQSVLTAAGVRLPNGSVLSGGNLSISLAVEGPAKSPLITGPVELNNTKLVGFDLGARISGVAALAGVKTGDTTVIEKMSFNLRAKDNEIVVNDLSATLPAIGEITGGGTVSPAGSLQFRLNAQITTAQGFGKMGVGLLSKLNRSKSENGAKGLPLNVTGTPNEPIITADMKGIYSSNKKALVNLFTQKK